MASDTRANSYCRCDPEHFPSMPCAWCRMARLEGSRNRPAPDAGQKGDQPTMIIRALSLSQPYATLIALGAKRIETRGYATSYRGPLAIHAAKRVPDWARPMMGFREFREALAPLGITCGDDLDRLPLGAIVATVRLVDVVSTDYLDPRLPVPGSAEWRFGDYSQRRYGWLLEDVEAIECPIPCSGALSLWRCELDLEQSTARRLSRAEAHDAAA